MAADPGSDPNNSHDPELKRALEKSEARYAALVERAGYGIYCSSVDGHFREVNATLVAMLGYRSVDELLGLDLARDVYLDPEERDRDRDPATRSRSRARRLSRS